MLILRKPDEQGESGATPPPSPSPPDITKLVEGIISRYGDPNAALRVLLNENHELRDKVRDLKGKVPGEGAVVLTGDDVTLWTSYRDLGDLKDLKKSLKAAEDATADAERLRKAETYRQAAELHHLRPGLLVREAQHDGLELVFEDVKEGKAADSKAVRTAFVKGEGDTKTPLLSYAEAHWPELMSALKVGDDATNGSLRKTTGTPPRREGLPVPPPGQAGEDVLRADLYQGGYANF